MAMPYENRRKYGSWKSRFLDTVGDGTGSIDANVDGSSTPVDFHYDVPENHILLISRLIIWIKDTGTFNADVYGNGIVLPNGITVGRTVGGVYTPRTTQVPIKTNNDWSAYSYDFSYIDTGNGDNVAVMRYSYDKEGAPITYPGGTKYTIRINDDLTGLTGHRFRLGCVLCPDKT